jgi:Tol biopolymer transport system component
MPVLARSPSRALPDGTGRTVLSNRPGFFSDWRSDGRRLAFDFLDKRGNQQIATMKPDGSDLRVITSGRGIHEVPSWSPSGRRIAFDYSPIADPETPGFETRIWTMRADGSGARPVPMRRPGFDVEPRYSRDGRWIAFGRLRRVGEDYEQAVFRVPAGGGRAKRLTPWGEYVEHPDWSPDGRWIVFNTPDGTIEKVRRNGRGRQTILPATESRGGHKPRYSPDGARIIFMCETRAGAYNEDICTMDTDGSDIVNLTSTPGVLENWPSWGPAPR